jgi:hypothetical protein
MRFQRIFLQLDLSTTDLLTGSPVAYPVFYPLQIIIAIACFAIACVYRK